MQPAAFLSLLDRAADRRASLPAVASGETNAFRLCDGHGDGLPGVYIDTYAGRWLVQTRDVPFPEPLRKHMPTGCTSIWWKELTNAQTLRDAPVWIAGTQDPQFDACENGVSYLIDFASGYSQGIFLDQRDNRQWLSSVCSHEHRVLNLFAYTCAFSVAGAMAGASTTSVDLSGNYLDWGRRNFALNGIDHSEGAGHRFFSWDTFDFLKMAKRKSERYSFIICDPPTFSRNKSGKVFRVEDDFAKLIQRCTDILEPGGSILCSTNHRGLPNRKFEELVRSGVTLAGMRVESLRNSVMPDDFTGDPYLKSVRVKVGAR